MKRGGYPPGAENDPRAPYNETDTSHEHKWRTVDGCFPIFEDGASIFVEECIHETVLDAERGYEGEIVPTQTIECDEERSYRFEYDTIETPRGEVIDLPTIHSWDSVDADTEAMVVHVEEAVVHGHDGVSVDVNPDRNDGDVVVEYDGHQLRYAP